MFACLRKRKRKKAKENAQTSSVPARSYQPARSSLPSHSIGMVSSSVLEPIAPQSQLPLSADTSTVVTPTSLGLSTENSAKWIDVIGPQSLIQSTSLSPPITVTFATSNAPSSSPAALASTASDVFSDVGPPQHVPIPQSQTTTSPNLGMPVARFVTKHTAGNVYNIIGDFYESNAMPHALDLLKLLDPIVMNAAYRHQCLPGTRVAILNSFLHDLTTPTPEGNVIWLTGLAGSGKSTLATTIAEHLHSQGLLGAFLFFDRNSPSQSGPDVVIRTLAYQLAMSNKAFRDVICDVIEEDPQIANRTLTHQFHHLLLQPLQACSSEIIKPIVVILDAFDECGDPLSRRALAYLLAEQLPSLPHQLRFVITGRPQLDLNNMFGSRPSVKAISLNDSQWEGDADVLLYIQHELDKLCQSRQVSDELPIGWPGMAKVRQLGERAADSFIYAATAMRYLYSADDVDKRLDRLLDQTAFTLEDLYATALWSASNWDPDEIATESCRKILGAVVVGRIPVTDDTIVDILGFEKSKACRLVLRKLSCVLQWSEGFPVRTLHASFTDYLTDPETCGDKPWFIDTMTYHLDFTVGCLRVMKRFLRFNICRLETSHLMNRDVTNLAEHIKGNIPSSLAYACRFWDQHLGYHANHLDPFVQSLISVFFSELFLSWLEVLSLVGEGRGALRAMINLENNVKQYLGSMHAFSKDSVRFIRAFSSIISENAPHIYISALPFAPSTSIIKQHYSSAITNTLRIQTDVRETWPSCEQVIETTFDGVEAVVFSPDGEYIASLSANAVCVWNVNTGEAVVGPLERHGSSLCAVAFSTNGERIMSCAYDGRVHIWDHDAQTGALIAEQFVGLTGKVGSMAFSPGGCRIACSSEENTIGIWDTITGEMVAGPFHGHEDTVTRMAFSPDGERIASCSDDTTIRVWDARTANLLVGPLQGDYCWGPSAVSFSPDSTCVISGAWDGNVRIWDAHNGQLLARTLDGEEGDVVTAVAISPDGERVVSVSATMAIHTWDAKTAERVGSPLNGHTAPVTSLVFSPNGGRLISGSWDKTLRIWGETVDEDFLEPSEQVTEIGHAVAFSPNGEHLASASRTDISIWDVENGQIVAGPFTEDTGMAWIISIMFSADGTCIISCCADATVRIRNIRTGLLVAGPLGRRESIDHGGEQVAMNEPAEVALSHDGKHIAYLSGPTICIYDTQTGDSVATWEEEHVLALTSVAFSLDGGRIASGSHEGTISVRDARTGGIVVGPLEGHTAQVSSVAFSPDGERVVSGSHDQTIRIWKAQTGDLIAGPFIGHGSFVTRVAFSPDGEFVVSASYDMTIRIWDAWSGLSIAGPFEGHTSEIKSVAFSPDGRRVASGSENGTIRIFSVYDEGDSASSGKGYKHTSRLENGWMQNSPTELLFWVPPAYRAPLWRPYNVLVLGQQPVRLDLGRFVHGSDWVRCYEPSPEAEVSQFSQQS
ncbi:hypothetical protein HWV62_9895 [Athelia sp. TMB]|nr:hypothetical protein HWV62_9895 [Athelia sp. TMB]